MPFYVGELSLPTGDSDGMRAKAASLRRQAATVSSTGRSVVNAIAGMQYRGPAATRFRAQMGWWQFGSASLVAQLNDIAQLLASAAAELDAERDRVIAHNQRLRAQALADAARRARGG